jgi:hypothetical protein
VLILLRCCNCVYISVCVCVCVFVLCVLSLKIFSVVGRTDSE